MRDIPEYESAQLLKATFTHDFSQLCDAEVFLALFDSTVAASYVGQTIINRIFPFSFFVEQTFA